MGMFVTNAMFINESYLKTRTPVNGQLDIKNMVPFIETAQDMFVQPIIGSVFYESLMNSIAGVTGASALSNDEKALLNVIQPMLAYYTIYHSIPFLTAEIRGAGIVKAEGNHYTATPKSEIENMRNAALGFAQFYERRLIDYLCANKAKFPKLEETEKMKSTLQYSLFDTLAGYPTKGCSCSSTCS